MTDNINIRFAKPEDVAALVDIYRPYVLDTAITFEYEVPSTEEFWRRMNAIQRKYPYIVAECCGEIVGYAYVGSFVGRAAYDWSVETTIYLKQDKRKQGVGRKLYEAMECILKEMHIINLNACIGYPETDDEYLTKNSVEFHRHIGYSLVGEFHKCGYKFGRWYNMVWMEKMIGSHPEKPVAIINVNDIRGLLQDKYHIE
ncbi:GNAT family N-acetyltransferase [Sinanaerobacter chloroacetimidivorans]|uniref:GNAT family N-acetyltransferase n=1 Tax=Sinanaerobacter chloroacetimidivorans TaxID=2818044 RepID=A0A8J7VZJ8_9FIRM|nr:GNAT family N-acetyltransferase [Sinanaerobacter chloroacetimidivorans]MBR0596431.1 GNAT family N-acetyltransferase [Sinanaerobacter chloroacetimidivorans]